MVEAIAPGSAESSRRSATRARVDMGVRTTTRYAVQLVTHLAGGERRVEFTRVHLDRTAQGKVLELDVANTGSAAYRLAFTLELYDLRGAQVGKLEERRGLVYPGSSIRQRFALPALPAGEYKALLVADTGAEDVFGAQYRLTL